MLDFVKLASAYHIPTITSGHSHTREGWIQAQCPFCGREGTHGGWYLGFEIASGVFHCWRCGGLRTYAVLAKILRLPESSDQLKQIIDKHQKGTARLLRTPKARPRTIAPPPHSGPMGPVHRKYLLGRGFDPDALAATWGLLGTGRFGGVWAWRIVYPVHDPAGVVVAWQGRTVGTGDKRYRFSDDKDCLADPRKLLYGLDKVAGGKVIVVEGCTGVWRFGPGAVATFGIDWDMAHVHLLRKFTHRYFIFDPETKAQERAKALARNLAVFGGHNEVISGFGTDPGAFTDDAARGIRHELGV